VHRVREVPGPSGDEGRTDAELLRDAAAGDRGAVGELFGRHRDRLWAVAVRTLGDREEAADALQDAFVSVLRTTSADRAGAFRGDAAPSTWLHRVVVNACLDRARRSAVRPAEPLPAAELPARGPDAFSGVEQALDLEQALRLLPLDQRSALVLVHMYGWSVQDAAEILDCQPGTVKSRCSRGRARLVEAMGAADGNRASTGGVPSPTVLTDPTGATNGGDHTP
jgi:RNA polymerase sigma-70 factor (ECF subfamily)